MNRTLTRILGGVVLAWFVVTYSGARVMGPFTLLNDCTDVAKMLALKYYNISTVCRTF